MNKRDVKKFQKMLLNERDHLLDGIRKLEQDDNSREIAHYSEAGTDNFERETTLNIVSGESEWLDDISDALARIQAGNYGTCEGCEEQINKKRLEAFPSARYCVQCQAKLERDGVL